MTLVGQHKEKFEVAVEAIREAGHLIRDLFIRRHPAQEADQGANEILTAGLSRHGAVLSEEGERHISLNHSNLWVVDPLDGSGEFERGIPEFAVSVAYLSGGLPEAGFVYNPVTDEFFHALRGKGAWKNGQRIPRSAERSGPWLVSRSDHRRGLFDRVAQQEIRVMGSIAYKLARSSEPGLCRGVLSVTPKNLWDYLGGAVIAREAGFCVADLEGHPLTEKLRESQISGLITYASTESLSRIREIQNLIYKEGPS